MTTCSVHTIAATHAATPCHHPHPSLRFMGSGTGSHSGSGSGSNSPPPPPIKTEPREQEEEDDEDEDDDDNCCEEEEEDCSNHPPVLPSTFPTTRTPPVVHSPPVGLLNHRHLVQDEKLVVATLASLDSGDPSNIIKQDLRLIIQSRRKAEGKGELQVDFKTPPKDELTDEEWEKVKKRRDQNRLAAQRFRQKQRRTSSTLSDRIQRLEAANMRLKTELCSLEREKQSLLTLLSQHGRACPDIRLQHQLI